MTSWTGPSQRRSSSPSSPGAGPCGGSENTAPSSRRSSRRATSPCATPTRPCGAGHEQDHEKGHAASFHVVPGRRDDLRRVDRLRRSHSPPPPPRRLACRCRRLFPVPRSGGRVANVPPMCRPSWWRPSRQLLNRWRCASSPRATRPIRHSQTATWPPRPRSLQGWCCPTT